MSKRPPGTSPITANLQTQLHTQLRHAVTDFRARGEKVTGEMLAQLGLEVVLAVIEKYPNAPFTDIEVISKRRRFKVLAALDEFRQASKALEESKADLESTMAEAEAMVAEDVAAAASGTS